jgi:hypothetical protein
MARVEALFCPQVLKLFKDVVVTVVFPELGLTWIEI